MILLDTSVLSAVLRRKRRGRAEEETGRLLSELLATPERVAVPGLVLQEVLSGIREEPQFEEIHQVLLDGYPIVLAEVEDHALAARVVNGCRRKGIAVSSGDALLAAITLQRAAGLFTLDQDFRRIATVFPIQLVGLA